MARTPIQSHSFVLVVVEHAGKFLLVQERKHGQTFYLPAGGVEVGETLSAAAVRETVEESGVVVRPTHLLALDQGWERGVGAPFVRYRFVLAATVVGDSTPKQTADRHSLGARWVTPDEARRLPLRAPEVVDFIGIAMTALPRLPLGLISQRGLATARPAGFDVAAFDVAAFDLD